MGKVTGIECSVCLIPYDEDTHRATLGIHRWLGSRIAALLVRPPEVARPVQPAAEPKKRCLQPDRPTHPDRLGIEAARQRARQAPRPSRQGNHNAPYNKILSMTGGAILDAFARGEGILEIARSFGCTRSAVSHRLHDAMRTDEALRERYHSLCRCACKKRNKQPSAATCNRCKTLEKKREQRRIRKAVSHG